MPISSCILSKVDEDKAVLNSKTKSGSGVSVAKGEHGTSKITVVR